MKAKNLLIGVLFLGSTIISNAQIKFTAEGKTISSFDIKSDDFKVIFTIPEKAVKFDQILFGVEDYRNVTRFNPAFSTARYYPADKFNAGETHEMWVMKPSHEDGDFCSSNSGGTFCYNPHYIAESFDRNFETLELEVKIMGRNIVRYTFNNQGEKVPVYETADIVSKKITMNMGPVIQEVSSFNDAYTTSKFKNGESTSVITVHDDKEMLDHTFNVDPNPVTLENSLVFRIRTMKSGETNVNEVDFSGGAPSGKDDSEEMTPKRVKECIAKLLMRKTDSRCKKYIEEDPSGYYWYSPNDFVYEPFLLPVKGEKKEEKKKGKLGGFFGGNGGGGLFSNGEPTEKDFVNHFENVKDNLEWKSGKIGNMTCEVLEIEVYIDDQARTHASNHTRYIKEEHKGKTQKVLFFVGEKDGKVFAGSIYKVGQKPLNESEMAFWNFITGEGITMN